MALPAGRSGGRSESASRRQGDAGNDAGLVLAVAEEALNRIGPLMSPASSIATTAPRCSTSIRPCFANRTATRRVLAMSSRQGPRSPSRRRGISEGLRSVCVMLCCVCKGGMGQGMRCEVRGLMFGKGRDGQGWADDSGVCSSALHPKHSNPPPPTGFKRPRTAQPHTTLARTSTSWQCPARPSSVRFRRDCDCDCDWGGACSKRQTDRQNDAGWGICVITKHAHAHR